jgi:hypothetical protein
LEPFFVAPVRPIRRGELWIVLTSKVARDGKTPVTGRIFDAKNGADAAQSNFTSRFFWQGEDQFHFHYAAGRALLRKNKDAPYPYVSREASTSVRPEVISFHSPTEQHGQLKMVTRTFSSLNKVKSGEG